MNDALASNVTGTVHVATALTRCCVCRYEDLIAEGVELHQLSTLASNSFSHASSVRDDTAPGNPQAGPSGPYPPINQGSQAATHESKITLQQQAQTPHTDNNIHQSAAGVSCTTIIESGRHVIQDGPARSSIQPALTKLESATSRNLDNLNGPQTLPLPAGSNSTLLSDRSAQAAQPSGQDRMMQSQLHDQPEATIASLSQGGVQISHRAAGNVSMAEGMSEPMTEAKRAPGVAEAGSDEDDESAIMTDARGRLIMV